MGVDLGDLFEPRPVALRDLAGQTIAIDAYNTLYQFLSIIRQPDGTPLMDGQGRVTSHLSGLLYRTTNLIEAGIRPLYVFDGRPPDMKRETLEARSRLRREAEEKWRAAQAAGDEEGAFRHAQQSARVTRDMVGESRRLLEAMGVPCLQAPSEGEAQAAHLAARGVVDGVGSQDFDALLFGAPRLVRNLTLSGRRKLPRRNTYVEITPEVVELEPGLRGLGIRREQLVDLGILVGTDFNPGIRGVGPKRALKLVKEHGGLEGALGALGQTIEQGRVIREFFLHPEVEEDPGLPAPGFRPEEAADYLCGERGFSRERVEKALERLQVARGRQRQQSLFDF